MSTGQDHDRAASQGSRNGRTPLGVELERIRVELRISRLEGVVAVLRMRLAEHRRAHGGPAGPLGRAVGDFEAELSDMRQWLQRLERETATVATEHS